MEGVEVESLHTLQKQQTINKRKELYYTCGFVGVKINTCPHIPWDLLVVGIQLNCQGMCTSLDETH